MDAKRLLRRPRERRALVHAERLLLRPREAGEGHDDCDEEGRKNRSFHSVTYNAPFS